MNNFENTYNTILNYKLMSCSTVRQNPSFLLWDSVEYLQKYTYSKDKLQKESYYRFFKNEEQH